MAEVFVLLINTRALSSQIEALRAETKQRLAEFRLEIHDELSAFRAEVREEIASFRLEVHDQLSDVRHRLERLEEQRGLVRP